MAIIIPIPLFALLKDVGVTIPGTPLPTGMTRAQISVDRTVGLKPLNSAPSGRTVELRYELSPDNQASWQWQGTPSTAPSGLNLDDFGQPINTDVMSIGIDPAAPWTHIRGIVTARGGDVSVAGTLAVS